MNIITKIKNRYNLFKDNPLTEKYPLVHFLKYGILNVKFLFTESVEMNWIADLKLSIRKGDAGIIGNYYFGLYEFEESIFLLHVSRKEDIFFDIGANLGHFSLLLSGVRKLKSVAVEPVPNTFNRLKMLIDFNNLGHLIDSRNLGVSDKSGELFFSTDKGTMNGIVDEKYKNKVSVKVLKIDELYNEAPVLLKIDVEGYEKFALSGAKNILSNHKLKIIIMELNGSGNKIGISDNEVYEQIIHYGFKPYKYDPFKRHIIELESYNKNQFNTIFIRDLHTVNERVQSSDKIKINNHFTI
ncbi:FkbM family methyltransferase [Polluticaenibacter yanchengensis]|uniref:FkbM family methyltransferase n=1 Tax=Polluticaenibacter yanchengensis TaxID=3014562 RepID=A0ABT4UFR7_9BACT|nr:FkbM family methyltransferase [Chitinophagaceae bacterium LY-5]